MSCQDSRLAELQDLHELHVLPNLHDLQEQQEKDLQAMLNNSSLMEWMQVRNNNSAKEISNDEESEDKVIACEQKRLDNEVIVSEEEPEDEIIARGKEWVKAFAEVDSKFWLFNRDCTL